LAGGRVFSGDEAVALGLADRLGDLPAAVARVRELAGISEALPLEILPYASGLAARLGLGGVQSAMLQVAIPPAIRVMVEQAQRSRLQVMAWTSPLTVE
jgi:ClpP class serine protease